MARETRLPLIGGGVGSVIGGTRYAETTIQPISPGSSPARDSSYSSTPTPMDETSYIGSSESRSRRTRMGSVFSIDSRTRSSYIRRLLDRFSGDSVNIAQTRIENGVFVPITENGINSFRPEIIATMDFMPIWQPNALSFADGRLKNASPIGELLNFQYQTKQLRQETLQALITNIKKSAEDDPFLIPEQNFTDELNAIQTSLSLLNSVIDNINTINDSLDIKNIPANNYVIRENFVDVAIPSLREFALSKMQYNGTQYDNFSETKLLLQLLFDLQNVLSNYSYNLLDFVDNDRIVDRSPSIIDKSYTLTDGFTFNILNYRSTTTPINALEIYESFNQSLPEEPDAVIKLLTFLLAKELIISTGLGNSSNTDIITNYGATNTIASLASVPQTDIFKNIIGNVGDNIFQLPTGLPNSVASLFYINPGLGPNNIVLPFENRYVSYDDNVTYIPGNSYFSDAIIRTDTSSWNVKPYVDYVNRFSNITISAESAIERLLNFRYIERRGVAQPTGIDLVFDNVGTSVSNLLSPMSVLQKLIEKYQTCFDKLDVLSTDNLGDIKGTRAVMEANATINTLNSKLAGLREQLAAEQASLDSLLGDTVADVFQQESQQDAVGGYIFIGINQRVYNIEQLTPQIEALEAELQVELEKLRSREGELQEKLGQVKIASEQTFIAGLYNYAANDIVFKKHLMVFCILLGVWNNSKSSTKSGFFNMLTLNEIKTTKDLFRFIQIPGDLNLIYKTILQNEIVLNPTIDGFNRGFLENAIQVYVEQILTPYIQNFVTDINAINAQVETVRNLFSAIVPCVEVDRISNILMNIIRGEFESNTVTKKIIEMIDVLYESTKQSDQVVYVFDNGRTKYNGLSLSTQFLFLHEIFINVAKKYSSVRIKKPIRLNRSIVDLENLATGRTRSEFSFDIDPLNPSPPAETQETYVGAEIKLDYQIILKDAFINIVNGNPSSPDNIAETSQNTRVYSDLYDIYDKLSLELNYIRDVLGILRVIRKRLTDTSTNVSTFFRQNALTTFLAQSPITNLDLIKYVSQLRLANLIYNDLKERVTYSDSLVTLPGGSQTNVLFEGNDLIVSDAIIPSEYNALVSFLSEENELFQTVPTTDVLNETIQRNNKIITIGIPTGFSKQLSDRVNVNQFNRQGAIGKQSDVIAINLYPNDMRFGEIVLKPITYIVDLSLFITKKDFYDLNAAVGESFSRQLLERIKVSDLENPNNIRKYGLIDIISDTRYSFLTEQQKRLMFRTLIQSQLISLYLSCLTGIRYNEDVFMNISSERVLNPALIGPINRYLNQQLASPPTVYTTTEDVIRDPNLSQKTKDTYRLMTYGNLVYNINEATKRVNTPKIFDRVYHLPIYLGAVQIDLIATNSTEAGRLALAKPAVQRYIVSSDSGAQYIVSNEPDDFIIKDVFFATLTNDTGTGVGLDWDRIPPEDTSSIINPPADFGTALRVLGLRRA